jgi:hypothetical protein
MNNGVHENARPEPTRTGSADAGQSPAATVLDYAGAPPKTDGTDPLKAASDYFIRTSAFLGIVGRPLFEHYGGLLGPLIHLSFGQWWLDILISAGTSFGAISGLAVAWTVCSSRGRAKMRRHSDGHGTHGTLAASTLFFFELTFSGILGLWFGIGIGWLLKCVGCSSPF